LLNDDYILTINNEISLIEPENELSMELKIHSKDYQILNLLMLTIVYLHLKIQYIV